jgi:hypothetical protein
VRNPKCRTLLLIQWGWSSDCSKNQSCRAINKCSS